MSYFGAKDYSLELARGNISGQSHTNKFGKNPDVDTGSIPEDIWDGGGIYVPPTANRTHDIKSLSAQDAGTLVSTGTIDTHTAGTAGGPDVITDASATFSTDSVAVGDVVLDDDNQDHSMVLSIDSETQLTIEPLHHLDADVVGDTYRIVTTAGTGASVVHIKNGQQKNGTLLTEFIILNGTTNVATVNPYYRIERMHSHGVGSGGATVGIITATAQTDSTVTAQINAGNGSTQMAFIHVPRGKSVYITRWYASLYRTGTASDALADMTLNSRLWAENDDGLILRSSMGISVHAGLVEMRFSPYLYVAQDEDLWIRAEDVSDNNSVISAGFDAIYVDNT